jgi:chromosome segregation ATPase
LNELKKTYAKNLSEYDELQKQCSLVRTRCQQLESERLPLIAQLEFADRNLRQVKKQQSAMATSTAIHHQPPLQSIENNNHKSVSRLVRSPSLDMRVMRRISKFSWNLT